MTSQLADTGIQPSHIAAEGLFATAMLAAGTEVLRYDEPPTSAAAMGPVNHSCDPTLGWADDRTLVVLLDVEAGTELTCDYATAVDDPELMLRCHCETYRCRQLIEGTDWQIPQLQRRYAGHWTPRLQQAIDAG